MYVYNGAEHIANVHLITERGQRSPEGLQVRYVMFWDIHHWFSDWKPSRTTKCSLRSHFLVAMTMCLRSLTRSHSWKSFSSKISPCMDPFILSFIRTGRSVLSAEKQAHNMMIPPPCFTVRLCSLPNPASGVYTKEFRFGLIWPPDFLLILRIIWTGRGAFWSTGGRCVLP